MAVQLEIEIIDADEREQAERMRRLREILAEPVQLTLTDVEDWLWIAERYQDAD